MPEEGDPAKKKGSRDNNTNNRGQRRSSNRGRGNNQQKNGSRASDYSDGNNKHSSSGTTKKDDSTAPYPTFLSLEACLARYAANDPTLVRGKLRVLPGDHNNSSSFVTCDRGWHAKDIIVAGPRERNRALDGDVVFVELLAPEENEEEEEEEDAKETTRTTVEQIISEKLGNLKLNGSKVNGVEEEDAGDVIHEEWRNVDIETWQDDPVQVNLWNPLVPGIQKSSASLRSSSATTARSGTTKTVPGTAASSSRQRRTSSATNTTCPFFPKQQQGRVIHILPPMSIRSELDPTAPAKLPTRRIVGTLKVLNSNTVLLTPNNRSLPQFKCHPHEAQQLLNEIMEDNKSNSNTTDKEAAAVRDRTFVQAEYHYGSWKENFKWPPCVNLSKLGEAFVVADEIQALLTEFNVDHGDFPADVLKNVNEAVHSGLYYDNTTKEQGWKPTNEMYKGRRDYRNERIFTIDPTTAKDLDDALHIKLLECGQVVEVGVHIADVSFFVQPHTPVDLEAQRRTTTVYLVDRTVPMLPRPLCEIACSLNENVERLAFSCVWRMNVNGTMCKTRRSNNKSTTTGDGGGDDVEDENVWFGRTVIRSCARLDYATAQNIIENKVATTPDKSENDMDNPLWPSSRRPTGTPHTVHQVASDVRLLHRVAMARRKLRFDNGALALNGTKLTFTLDEDGQTPLLAAPYPIRDSNRLVEEYMLLANYLVAQRLITHANGLAVLRLHPEPVMEGLDNVVNLAKVAMDFDIDPTTSQTLHDSLVRFSHESSDLLLQCMTNLIMTPMRAAEYFCAGLVNEREMWKHYALNIPYYTHFTSPIRRYPDVLVHRLLQATIDGDSALKRFPQSEQDLGVLCEHCNDKRKGSKDAQERCDRVFLSLFVKMHPLKSQMGVVLSVGKSTFTVFVPSLGTSSLLYLQEHTGMLSFAAEEEKDGTRRILLQQKPPSSSSLQQQERQQPRWNTIEIKIFVKLMVTVVCKDKPPIDIKLRLEGPWRE